MRKKTTEDFIKDAKTIHGDRYDYSNVIYKSTHEKIAITCKVHGNFNQSPANHLRGQGCDKCADKLNGQNQRKSTEQFISEAKAIFGNQYIYEKTNYTTNENSVIITCKIHGDFYKTPNKHLFSKQGCPKCAEKIGREKRKILADVFLKKQRDKFGNSFKFPNIQIEYNGIKSQNKISIVCRKCNTSYKQAPYTFLRSNGCLTCLKHDIHRPPKGQSLGDLYSNSLKFWGNNGKYTPFDFFPNSGRKMNWICPTCNSPYIRSIQAQFTHRNIGCKNCKGRIYYTEKKILFELKSFYPDILGDGIGKQVDMFIPTSNSIIEYDGINWHKSPEKLRKDKTKTKKLINEGYKVIRLREKPLKKITPDDIIIDAVNQGSIRKQAKSIKIVVSKILSKFGHPNHLIAEYLKTEKLVGEPEYNKWLDKFMSIAKDELEFQYILLNKTKAETCKHFGLSLHQLNNYLIRYDLQKKQGNFGRKPPNRKDPTDIESIEITRLYKSGKSLKAIAASTQYSTNAIKRTLNKFNLQLRLTLHNEKKVIQRNINGKIIKQFDSLKQASEATGVARPNISHCCNGTRKVAGGYYWEYLQK